MIDTLAEIHAAHVAWFEGRWRSAPASDDPAAVTFLPQVMALATDADDRVVEWACVAPTPTSHETAAEALGAYLAHGGAAPIAVTQAAEMWVVQAPSGGPRGRRREALVVASVAASGDRLTTIRAIDRSNAGEAALGSVLARADPHPDVAGLSAATFRTYRARRG